jgi:ABC-type transporter Mla subunit MlaD
MSSQRLYFRVGAFVLATSLLGIASIIIFGSIKLGRGRPLIVESYFTDTVQGLTVGSRVKMRGVIVGTVDSIDFAQDLYPMPDSDQFEMGNWVVVRMSIDRRNEQKRGFKTFEELVADRVSRGMRMRMASQGITGQKYVEVEILDPERFPTQEVPWEPKYIYVPSAPTVLKAILETFAKVGRRLEDVNLAGMAEDLKILVKNLRHGTEGLDVPRLMEKVENLVAEIETVMENPEIPLALTALRETLEGSREMVGKADDLITGDAVQEAVADFGHTMDNLEHVTESMNRVVEQLDVVLVRMDDLLATGEPQMQQALIEMRAMMKNLRELTDMAKRYPSMLILGEPPPRISPGEEQ